MDRETATEKPSESRSAAGNRERAAGASRARRARRPSASAMPGGTPRRGCRRAVPRPAGYEIVERNWTCAAGEADIVARDGETVVFVEVKTRSSCDKGMPAEAVDAAKRERYERIAALFLQGYDAVDVPVRFDIVSIVAIAPDRALVRHHIDAFGAA
ncbi:MAG: YraN family protein [Eggerthellaceae bacterium]